MPSPLASRRLIVPSHTFLALYRKRRSGAEFGRSGARQVRADGVAEVGIAESVLRFDMPLCSNIRASRLGYEGPYQTTVHQYTRDRPISQRLQLYDLSREPHRARNPSTLPIIPQPCSPGSSNPTVQFYMDTSSEFKHIYRSSLSFFNGFCCQQFTIWWNAFFGYWSAIATDCRRWRHAACKC